MKIRELLDEHRNVTLDYKVDVIMTTHFINKYKHEPVPKRSEKIKEALYDLLDWYNYKGNILGKIKINYNSTDCYHYHIGFPAYFMSANHRYSTYDWFILFKLQFNYERDLYEINVYDYDNHDRRGDWNI